MASMANTLAPLAKMPRASSSYRRRMNERAMSRSTIARRAPLASLLAIALCGSAPASAAPTGAASTEPAASELSPLPFNLSLVPPLSVNALYRFRTVNAFALDLLAGNSGALAGVEVSGIGSRNGDVRGAQVAGIGNWVDAGAYGQPGDARGAQLAGVVNWAGGSLRGAQIAGVLNHAGRDASGAQLAGVANLAPSVNGVQLAGVVNVASEASTVQLAVVNVTGQSRGAQLGVVNVAEDADVSVGVLSWVKSGTHDGAVGATEYGLLAEADTGGRTVYGILTGGTLYQSDVRRYLLGFGVGWRAHPSDAVALDVQGTWMRMVDADAWTDRQLCTARAVVAARVAGPLSVFAGPTFNVFIDAERQKIEPAGYGWKIGSDVQLWPGFLAGIRLF